MVVSVIMKDIFLAKLNWKGNDALKTDLLNCQLTCKFSKRDILNAILLRFYPFKGFGK